MSGAISVESMRTRTGASVSLRIWCAPREIHGGTAPPVTKVGMTTRELLARYRETHEVSADENGVLRHHIEPRWNSVKLRDISWSDIAAWWPSLRRVNGLPGPMAEGTKRLALARFGALLEYGIEIGALSINPVKQIPRKRKPKQGEVCSADPDARRGAAAAGLLRSGSLAGGDHHRRALAGPSPR